MHKISFFNVYEPQPKKHNLIVKSNDEKKAKKALINLDLNFM